MPEIAEQLAVDARYAVYLKRQEIDIAAFRKEESVAIPHDFAFAGIAGLSTELRQKLERDRPGKPRPGGAARRHDAGRAAAAARPSEEGLAVEDRLTADQGGRPRTVKSHRRP